MGIFPRDVRDAIQLLADNYKPNMQTAFLLAVRRLVEHVETDDRPELVGAALFAYDWVHEFTGFWSDDSLPIAELDAWEAWSKKIAPDEERIDSGYAAFKALLPPEMQAKEAATV